MLYDIGFFIFCIFYLPALIFKGKLHKDFLQRFGIYDFKTLESLSSPQDKVWIQAVSVGEVALCKRLIPLMRTRFPRYRIVLSTITKTGNNLAKKLFSNDAAVIYFPLDFTSIVKRVARLIRPRLYIMIETEIWPNLISELSRLSIPSILINGRISDKSFGRYKLARPFLKDILKKIDSFYMQSETDAKRIRELGAASHKVIVTGNMKFDVEVQIDEEKSKAVKTLLNLKPDELLLVAGSTHKGEEEIVVRIFKEVFKEFPNLKLLVAPRHIDRVVEVEVTVKRFGFDATRVSDLYEGRRANDERRVYILDTIGQLNDFYSAATLVFIGGSLVKHGGQNPIEPAKLEKPILFGPYMHNFKEISKTFLENGAAIQVEDEKGLLGKIEFLLRNEKERARLGEYAKRVVIENGGATERNLKAITQILE